jgi:hypothetical protein
LASIPSTDTASPNTIVSIDPVSAAVGTPVSTGLNPDLLSVSSDGSYLWVGIDGDFSSDGTSGIQRFLLPRLTRDISITLPDNAAASSLEAAPVDPHTVGIVAWHGDNLLTDGVYVYDDAIPRPKSIPGNYQGGPDLFWVQWGQDDSTLYGVEAESGVATLPVTSAGVSLQSWNGSILGLNQPRYNKGTGLLYSDGLAYDPAKYTLEGIFNLSAADAGSPACTADSAIGRFYCVVSIYTGVNVAEYQLWVFNLNTYAMIEQLSLGGTAAGSQAAEISGFPVQLIRWGNAGLALVTSTQSYSYYGTGGLFLFDGPAINPNATPDSTAGEAVPVYATVTSISPQGALAGSAATSVTFTGTNFTPDSAAAWQPNNVTPNALQTTYVSPSQVNAIIPAAYLVNPGSSVVTVIDSGKGNAIYPANSLEFTVYPSSVSATTTTAINLAGLDLAWDAAHSLIYVAVADYDAAYPNSIVAVSSSTGSIMNSQPVGPDPCMLSVSAQGQYLYVGYESTTNLTQFTLPALTSALTWPLLGPQNEAYFPGDLKSAPVSPHTSAVTLAEVPVDTITTYPDQVAVYDDATQRPDLAGGLSADQPMDVLAWGNTDSILAAAEDDGRDYALPLYTLAVNLSGPTYLGTYGNFNYSGFGIYSDFGTGLVYSEDGNVANPVTGGIVGSYPASGLIAPDSSLNRVFFLGQTAAQAQTTSYTIQSFNETAFTPVSSISIDHIFGAPIAFIRWGASGFALLTVNEDAGSYWGPGGMLYILQSSTFASMANPQTSMGPVKQEPVQLRWRKPSKTRLMRMLRGQTSNQYQ